MQYASPFRRRFTDPASRHGQRHRSRCSSLRCPPQSSDRVLLANASTHRAEFVDEDILARTNRAESIGAGSSLRSGFSLVRCPVGAPLSGAHVDRQHCQGLAEANHRSSTAITAGTAITGYCKALPSHQGCFSRAELGVLESGSRTRILQLLNHVNRELLQAPRAKSVRLQQKQQFLDCLNRELNSPTDEAVQQRASTASAAVAAPAPNEERLLNDDELDGLAVWLWSSFHPGEESVRHAILHTSLTLRNNSALLSLLEQWHLCLHPIGNSNCALHPTVTHGTSAMELPAYLYKPLDVSVWTNLSLNIETS